MSKISRPDTTSDLVNFFLSAGENPTPSELSEEVLLTFPFAPPTIELRRRIFEVVVGGAGAVTVTFGAVPDDEYWIYHCADLDHDDATARPAWFEFDDADTTLVSRIVFDPSITSTGFLTVRNVVVPPRCALRGRLDTIAGVSVLVMRGMKTVHKLAQPLMGTSS